MPLVPLLTNSGPGAPLYAAAGTGGGGGGGGGPNLAVSTLSVAPTGSITLDYVAYPQNTSLTFNANSNGNSANILLNIDNGSLPSGAVNGGNPQQTTFLEQTNGTFIADAAFLALRGVNYVNYGSGFPGQTTGTIFSAANELRVDGAYPVNFHTPGVSISSLSVSSLNGASPGGGGGGPPPAATSTILALTNLSSINNGTPQLLLVAGDVGITGGYLAAPAISTNQISPLQGAQLSISTIGGTQTILQMSGDSGGYVLLDAGQSEGAITLKAYSTIITNDLNVSSINGAAPGGGGSVPPDLSLSTLTFNSTSGVIKFLSDKLPSGQLAFGLYTGEINNLSTITGGVLIDGTGNFEALPLYADGVFLNGPTSYTSSVMGSIRGGGPINSIQGSLIADCRGLYVTNTAGAPNTNLFASTIECSTINGAPVAALKFSTLSVPGGPGASTFVCDPAVANILVSFSTIAGHVYSATTYARAQVFEAATNGQVVYTEILDDNTGNDPIGNWPAQAVSTLAAGGGYQQVGGSVMWKAGGTGAAFCVVPDVSTLVRVDGINLMDFGAV